MVSTDVLIAIEGVDGCGKSTQVELLVERLEQSGIVTHATSFPRYSDPNFGDLIKRFLGGDLGKVDDVHPRLVALLFAGDRGAEASNLRQALCEDKLVICDRYFYSNLAYQSAKLTSDSEVDDFTQWLRKLEFGHYAVPAPALSIYLDVHQDERKERLRERKREQANGKLHDAVPDDIHEQDGGLQARVEEVFRAQAEIRDDLVGVDCQQYGRRLAPEEVHAKIMRILRSRQLIPTPSAGLGRSTSLR